MTDRPKARAVRGFQDRRAESLAAEERIIAAVARTYESFGFERLESPAVEYADALGKFLPDADRPNAGIFAFQDDDEQWLSLRYDHTAPLARFAAENWAQLAKPFRRYAFGPVWRDEKPGPGRYRQFMQCDADTVGSARPEADAEIIAMAAAGYAAAGLPAGACIIRINNRKLLNGLLAAQGIASEAQRLAVLRAVDKLDRLGAAGVADLLGAGRLDESGAFTRGAELSRTAIDAVLAFLAGRQPSRRATLDALSGSASAEAAEGVAELARIDVALAAMGVDDQAAVIDPAVVRGLEYYTGAVFEADLVGAEGEENPARFGSVGGGGRYDDLVARFTGAQVPATGFSFGVSRLAAVLASGTAAKARGPVMITALESERMDVYLAAAAELRAAGIAAEVYLGESGLRAQMKYADRRSAPAAVILGADEIAAGQATVKDLDLGRALAGGVEDNRAWRADRPGQVTAARADLVATVAAILAAQS